MAGLRGRALIAYLLVCVVWGSTYLAIRIGVADLPPFLFAGARFFAAGILLGGAILATGGQLPRSAREWKILAIGGTLLLVGGNAIVVWAEQTMPSGLASVYVAAGPLWTALFDSLVPGGKTRLTWKMGLGLLAGFLGICLLSGVTPDQFFSTEIRGPIALTLAAASWAMGSVYTKRHPVSVSTYSAAVVQMTVAGALLLLLGLGLGEARSWHLTTAGAGSLAYLIFIGSLVGYTAFGYALRHSSPTVVGTFAYVNPVVAVLLGSSILHEQVTARMLIAMAVILGAVLWIQLSTSAATKSDESGTALPEDRKRKTA